MKLIALASVSVLLLSGVAAAQDQPAAPPAQPAQPAQPAAVPAPPATAQTTPSYAKGWNEKKCADAKTKGKKIPDGACPDAMAPK